MFHFKSFIAAGVAAAALSACVETTNVSSSGASANRWVTIQNATGRTIWRLYGSRTSTSSWEEDILGSTVLSNGSSVNINFDDGTGACMFDMKAEFRDGGGQVLNNVNVCSVASVTFR
ncbi:hypothetical protein [Loktanella sp. Alg231-35]|uniref:hypothetical protein n=1 Tax=Loktanella sp. Alg231-35 TaxID=1922220 RepID=UPI0018FF50C4|nr:hypothetical protein [Loktanella sp. Alg231-35]